MAQNEALAYQRPRNGESADTFICECVRVDCGGVLDLSIGEYARVRSHPRLSRPPSEVTPPANLASGTRVAEGPPQRLGRGGNAQGNEHPRRQYLGVESRRRLLDLGRQRGR